MLCGKIVAMRTGLLTAYLSLAAGWTTGAGSPQSAPPVPTTVTIDVTVVDRNGRSVPGLAAADFTVQLDGQAHRIVTTTYLPAGAPMAGGVGPMFDSVAGRTPGLPDRGRASCRFLTRQGIHHRCRRLWSGYTSAERCPRGCGGGEHGRLSSRTRCRVRDVTPRAPPQRDRDRTPGTRAGDQVRTHAAPEHAIRRRCCSTCKSRLALRRNRRYPRCLEWWMAVVRFAAPRRTSPPRGTVARTGSTSRCPSRLVRISSASLQPTRRERSALSNRR